MKLNDNQKETVLNFKFYKNFWCRTVDRPREIHTKCLSEDPKERIKALKQLDNYFSIMPDKQQAWNDLHKLTSDEDSNVRHGR